LKTARPGLIDCFREGQQFSDQFSEVAKFSAISSMVTRRHNSQAGPRPRLLVASEL
jgi:hypothetical protein